MADVRLDFYDLDDDALPDVCMKCAAPSTVRPIKTFSWMPYWARFVPFGIGMAFMRRRRVPIPLCEQHKHYWTMRYLVIFGGLAAFLFLLICGGFLFAANVDADSHGPLTLLGGLTMALSGIVFFAWLVAAIILGVTQINVFEITDDSIVLKNVSSEFVRAYREMTREGYAPDVDDLARRQFGRPGGDPRRRSDDYPPDDKYRR